MKTALANDLRTLREARGWTQVDLAYHSRVSIETIRRMESGRYSGNPSLRNAVALAQALGVSLDVLFPERAAS